MFPYEWRHRRYVAVVDPDQLCFGREFATKEAAQAGVDQANAALPYGVRLVRGAVPTGSVSAGAVWTRMGLPMPTLELAGA